MRILSEGIVLVTLFAIQLSLAVDICPHDDFLRENYKISEPKDIWTDAEWWIYCFFVDLNNDGFVEVISTTVSQADRSGNASSFWTTKPDGRLHRIREDLLVATNFTFTSYCYSYYQLDCRAKRTHVVGLDMNAGFTGDDRRFIVDATPDCFLRVDDNNQLLVSKIDPNLDTIFYKENVLRIARLYSEGYQGYNFKYTPATDWFGYKYPKPIPVSDAPDGFSGFAASYKKEAQMRAGATNDVPIYAVFLDADNDGHADCYMTSEADCVEKDVYRWFLYKNAVGKFAKARDAVHPVAGRDDLPTLNPRVLARKDAFCRIIRFDVPPTYIVLDAAKVEKGMVKKTITYRWTHSIEKLPCHVY